MAEFHFPSARKNTEYEIFSVQDLRELVDDTWRYSCQNNGMSTKVADTLIRHWYARRPGQVETNIA